MTERAPMTIKHPKITDAKKIAGLYELSKAIVLFQLPDGRWGYASYGKDRAHCIRAQVAGNLALDAIQRSRGL